MTRIDDLETTFADDIARIRKMSNNVATMNEVEFAYDRLMKLPLTMPITLDYLLEVQVLTTGLVTAYGRLFARSTGTTKLDPKALPSELRPIHQQIIDLRNERYAHHGRHPSIEVAISLTDAGDAVILNQSLSIGMWLGAARHWQPLIVWWRVHLFERLHNELDYLSRKSGVPLRMADGPAPDWAR